MTLSELADDSAACVQAGARAFHVHPRDAEGSERLDAVVVDSVVAAVRGSHGYPLGVTTGAWIEPDVVQRARLVGEWTEPNYASVNVSEDGALEVMQALLGAGVGIEAGVWSVADAELLVRSGALLLASIATQFAPRRGQPSGGEAAIRFSAHLPGFVSKGMTSRAKRSSWGSTSSPGTTSTIVSAPAAASCCTASAHFSRSPQTLIVSASASRAGSPGSGGPLIPAARFGCG